MCRTLNPVVMVKSNYPLDVVVRFTSNTQDFASTPLKNLNCKVGAIISLSTLSQAFDKYVYFKNRCSSKSFKDTENLIKMASGILTLPFNIWLGSLLVSL